ncbi:hypothetical protein IAT38_006971 [Cryptococcus sp. DSM 104549]
MDALRPGHAHRSSSDRLLNNYLDSQKSLTTSLLTLLSHSHSSTSSLLAYVTSSPGVLLSIRRSVRHAAFEGPLSASITDHPSAHSAHGENPAAEGGWAAYISSLDQFRKDLKQIHLLEEEMSRVKRDREILVTRLIKTTKARPNKKDISAIAQSYSAHSALDGAGSSRASVMSDGSTTSKEGKRAGKLADAQAELLGCEEHLRGLEVRIENERNRVMTRGLEERFRSMEVVGRMWVQQAKRGLADLDKMHDLPPDAFELDSNGSLAPSQSASQVAYDDAPHNPGPNGRGVPFPRGAFHHAQDPAGSITGSIAEEDEDGSSDEDTQHLVVHENRPGGAGGANGNAGPGVPAKGRNTPTPRSPLGVPSVNSRAAPLGGGLGSLGGDGGSDSPRSGGRRAASDIGAMGYRPPTGRTPLRRTFSHDAPSRGRRGGSDTSSIREHKPKKKGFFASIGRLFRGSGGKRRGGSQRSSSPPYGSGPGGKGAWSTRTDTNLKRASTLRGGRGGDESSSDDEAGGNFVSVTNNRNSTWSVDAPRSGSGVKRSASTPVASGLIPAKPASGLKRNNSQSTVLANKRASGGTTPTPGKKPAASGGAALSRSGTAKSGLSSATSKTATTTGGKKKTRTNGSIARASSPTPGAGVAGRNIMTLVDSSTPGPVMPEVPKAPRSQVNPQMDLARAPGSSIVPADAPLPPRKPASAGAGAGAPTSAGPPVSAGPALGRSISTKSVKSAGSKKPKASHSPPRSTTPLPPSRTLSPPLKSALRPTSPSPHALPPPVDIPVKPMYSISAPGPVSLPAEPEPEPTGQSTLRAWEAEAGDGKRPDNDKRHSYVSMQSDGASIYESAVEDEDGNAPASRAGAYGPDTDSEDESTLSLGENAGPAARAGGGKYKVVKNEKVLRRGEVATGIPGYGREDEAGQDESDGEGTEVGVVQGGVPRAPAPVSLGDFGLGEPVGAGAGRGAGAESTLSAGTAGTGTTLRRKSVRMAVPDSPMDDRRFPNSTPTIDASSNPEPVPRSRTPSPEPERFEQTWSTRIGHMRDDTSEEEDREEGYIKARKGLLRNSGKWEVDEGTGKRVRKGEGKKGGSETGLKKKASTKSKASTGSVGRRQKSGVV